MFYKYLICNLYVSEGEQQSGTCVYKDLCTTNRFNYFQFILIESCGHWTGIRVENSYRYLSSYYGCMCSQIEMRLSSMLQ